MRIGNLDQWFSMYAHEPAALEIIRNTVFSPISYLLNEKFW